MFDYVDLKPPKPAKKKRSKMYAEIPFLASICLNVFLLFVLTESSNPPLMAREDMSQTSSIDCVSQIPYENSMNMYLCVLDKQHISLLSLEYGLKIVEHDIYQYHFPNRSKLNLINSKPSEIRQFIPCIPGGADLPSSHHLICELSTEQFDLLQRSFKIHVTNFQ